MITEKEIALIESYLANELAKEEVRDIEKRMKLDPGFADQVRLIQGMPIVLRTDIKGFKEDLASVVDQAGQLPSTKVKPLVSRRWLVAASIAAVVGLITLFYPRKGSPDQLFASYFTVPDENITVRNQTNADQVLVQAINDYNAKQFAAATAGFAKILTSSPDRIDVAFYLAIALMADDRVAEAIQAFEAIQKHEGVFSNAIDWYQALAYLKLGDVDSATEFLQELTKNGPNRYMDRSEKLLTSLKQLQ